MARSGFYTQVRPKHAKRLGDLHSHTRVVASGDLGTCLQLSVKHEVAATHTTRYKRRFHCCMEFASPQVPSAIVFSGVLHPQELCLRVMNAARSALFRLSHILQAPSRRGRLSVQSQGPSPTLLLSRVRRSCLFSVCCSSVTLDLEPIEYPCTVTYHPTPQSVS